MPKFEIEEQVIVGGITHIVTGRQKDPMRGWQYEVESGTWHSESALRSKRMHRNLPQGCGPEKTRRLHKPLKSRVDITYFCTACGNKETVSVQWRSHHALPTNWKCRDIVPTNELPRRTDHIFSCSEACRKVLDIQYPPPKKPKWFASS